MKVNIIFHGLKLKSKLSTNKTMSFTKRSFFYVVLGFTESHSGVLVDFAGFVQLIPGSYKK